MKNTLKHFLGAGSRRERWLAAVIFALSLAVAGNAYVVRVMMKQGEEFAIRAMVCEVSRFTAPLPLPSRPKPGLTL